MAEHKFVDVSKEEKEGSVIKRQWNKWAPEWRIVENGLALEGTCSNKNCKAFNKSVLISVGFGCFDLILDADKHVCPLCKKYVNPMNCGFNNCQYRMTGIKIDNITGQPSRFQSSSWVTVGNYFQTYDPKVSGECIWTHLKIHARELPKPESQAQREKEPLNACFVCKKTTSNAPMSCGHYVHSGCYQKIPKEFRKCLLCHV